MKNKVFEMSSEQVAGRRNIKWIIHEIFSDSTQFNKNGISWSEKYTQDNIESAKSMPICVQFYDDWEKTEPFGHGDTGMKDNMPIFEDSVVVGVTENAYIDNVEVNGRTIRALIGEGAVYEQRYPKFVDWLKLQVYDKKPVETSVEICAKKGAGYETIVYDGGWKEEGRVPQIYDYSGDAILGIEPADDSAILLELNQNKRKKDEDNKNIELNSSQEDLINKNNTGNFKEDNLMDEKIVLELNNKLDEKNVEINKLQGEVKDKDTKIHSLELNMKDLESVKASNQELTKVNGELNSNVEELNKKMEAISAEKKKCDDEMETKVKEVNEVKDALVTTQKDLEKANTELNELRERIKQVDNQKLVNELNEKLAIYNDDEKSLVKEKVEMFSKEPSAEKISEIVNEINSAITTKILENRKNNVVNEVNSKKDDILGDMYDVKVETSDTEGIY